jgi:hypothetical protein
MGSTVANATSTRVLPQSRWWRMLVAVQSILVCGPALSPAWSDTAVPAEYRFRTPQSTAAHWVDAVNKQDWREEYECYAGAQQAAFTYHLMLSTRELGDDPDLAIKLGPILARHRFPHDVLDEFPSHRLDLSALTDPKEIEAAIQGQLEKRRTQLLRWEREVQSLNVNWPGLVEDLQPLLTESYRRHQHGVHPSATGIAHHLGFHQFDPASTIEENGNRADGSVVAIVRDPDWIAEPGVIDPKPWRLNVIPRFFGQGKSHIKRAPKKIELVKQADGWKLEAAPFR